VINQQTIAQKIAHASLEAAHTSQKQHTNQKIYKLARRIAPAVWKKHTQDIKQQKPAAKKEAAQSNQKTAYSRQGTSHILKE
jgi:hypothetical protein